MKPNLSLTSKTSKSIQSDSPNLLARFYEIRAQTVMLCESLSAEDCTTQSMPDASPAKWHLAHTSWFFETFLLERKIPHYQAFNPSFRVLFNSYYNTVGEQFSRPNRGLLSRPSLEQVLRYRSHVDTCMLELLSQKRIPQPLREIIELGLQHEQQHQELILTDVKHLFSCNPLYPTYRECPEAAFAEPTKLNWHFYTGGIKEIGYQGNSFSFDNERPPHRVLLEDFQLATCLVTNEDYLGFMEDDGYKRPELWLADGWATSSTQVWRAPLYWILRDGVWYTHTLSGLRRLRLDEPLCHLSYYEADAFARWSGARLPTEAEWEHAAGAISPQGNFVESGFLHPIPSRSINGLPSDMFGNVWEWTQSPYLAYPGFRAPAGALGEYNGKFMCNQIVLRGGSCVTPASHIRASYRNFFAPQARWQFSGLRLARDAD